MDDAELESWHDYEVHSHREIVALLRQLAEKNSLVRMLIKGESDVCVTTILAVDEDSNTIVLDRSIDQAQNLRMANAPRVKCETTLDKIRILFGAVNLAPTTWRGEPALRADIPPTLIRLQRREYYRMPTPVTNPVRALIPVPMDGGNGGMSVFALHDISVGGIALLDGKQLLETTIGRVIGGCRIELPEIGPIITSLEIRNSLDLTLLNHKTTRRLGCQFVDISRGGLAAVQRYITKLERERNAKRPATASRITFATSAGRDCCGTWLDGSSVVRAPIFFAMSRCSCGSIMRSLLLTIYHDGLTFHAAPLTFSPNALPLIGPWVALITAVCAAGTSCAKSSRIASGGKVKKPSLSATSLVMPGDGAYPLPSSALFWPASGANAAT
jgi:c-di-GMP-binding flagellar brake protein YcgR